MIRVFCLLLLLALCPSLAPAQETTERFGQGDTPFLIRSTTDIAIIRPLIESFAARRSDLAITYEQWGSNALFEKSREDCRRDEPGADAILSSAVQQMVWLVNGGCASPYRSPETLALPSTRRWRDEIWGITTEPAVIAYNKAAFAGHTVPNSRFALLDALRNDPDRFRRKIATYDIAESGLGYLFAFSDSLEATTFGALLESFARVDAVATCCSAEIIAGVAEGRYLVAYNVLGSYVTSAARPEVATILPEDYTLVLSRAYMIPRQARQKGAATGLLDFLLTAEARAMLDRVGLITTMEASETGLPLSARRSIALAPPLLVALDSNRRAQLLKLWKDTFAAGSVP